MLTKGTFYPVHDRPSQHTLHAAGLRGNQHWGGIIRARWNGEKRPPKKGEFYLSGAEVGAYRAFSDLTEPYHIAELVTTQVTSVVTVLDVLPN